MAEATIAGLDIFMRYTDPEGKATVREQRVWDKERFLAARQAEADKENARQRVGEPRLAGAQQITREQYLKERK